MYAYHNHTVFKNLDQSIFLIFNHVLIIIQDACILTTDILITDVYCYNNTPHFVSAWDPRVHDTLR